MGSFCLVIGRGSQFLPLRIGQKVPELGVPRAYHRTISDLVSIDTSTMERSLVDDQYIINGKVAITYRFINNGKVACREVAINVSNIASRERANFIHFGVPYYLVSSLFTPSLYSLFFNLHDFYLFFL